MMTKKSDVYYYPTELSARLISCVSHGEREQVDQIFDMIKDENTEKRSLSNNLMKFLCSDIRNSLLRARNSIKENDENAEKLKKVDGMFAEKLTLATCEDLALSLCDCAFTAKDEGDIIKDIKAYIDENYADPSLGLAKIGDTFGLSESYFSHLFKEKIGVNFSSYLESIRMKKSYDLIRENPDINVSDIILKVGYNNANSFRRVFKKTYNMTPGQMRDSVK